MKKVKVFIFIALCVLFGIHLHADETLMCVQLYDKSTLYIGTRKLVNVPCGSDGYIWEGMRTWQEYREDNSIRPATDFFVILHINGVDSFDHTFNGELNNNDAWNKAFWDDNNIKQLEKDFDVHYGGYDIDFDGNFTSNACAYLHAKQNNGYYYYERN